MTTPRPAPATDDIVEAVLAELDATGTESDVAAEELAGDEVAAAEPAAAVGGEPTEHEGDAAAGSPDSSTVDDPGASHASGAVDDPGAIEGSPDVSAPAERGTSASSSKTRGDVSDDPSRPRSKERGRGRAGPRVWGTPVADPVASPINEPPHLVVGKTPGVLADDNVAEAGRKVLRFHLARMIAREPGTRDGSDPEDLKAMRVATRRQRAAWRVFGEAFRPERTKKHRGRLREVAGRLGAVRDLDVLIEAGDAYRADLPVDEQRAIEPLLTAWRLHRDDARVLLMRELDSGGYRRWLDDYAEFVRHEGVAVRPVAPTEPHRIRDTAASRIQAAYEHVRSYEPVLRWADVDTLHELRIHGKWLRYSLEFVREALPADVDGLIARVTALQDHLGLMKDADVAAHLARSFLVEHAGSISALESAAIARYLVSREKEVARLHRTVGRAWRGVAGVAFRRALGRTLAGL